MTEEQVMKETRRVLFLMAALFFVCAALLIGFGHDALPAAGRRTTTDAILAAVICAVAGVFQSFWFRFGCIALCLAGLALALLSGRADPTAVIFFIAISANMLYRMLKYRGVQEEPEELVEENPLTPLFASSSFPNVSLKTVILAVVIGAVVVLFNIVVERWNARHSDEWKKQISHARQYN